MRNYGFSLVELLVIIAIAAIIFAAATPTYRKYIIQSTVANSLPNLQGFAAYTKQLFNEDDLNFPITYSGVTFTANDTAVVYDFKPIVWSQVYTPNSVSGVGANEWMICFQLKGLAGIPNYVEPTTSAQGEYSRVCNLFNYENGIYKSYCGRFSPANNLEIPQEYLPSGCNCLDISTKNC